MVGMEKENSSSENNFLYFLHIKQCCGESELAILGVWETTTLFAF